MTHWFPLFGRDFLTATTGWTAEERGHYITLLIVQWEQGALPDDVKRLELISPGIRSCWKAIADKFPIWQDGRRRNTRLEHERSKAEGRSEKARQSASKLWAGKRPEAPRQADHQSPADSPSCQNGICEGICDGICERISERTSEGICSAPCSADASTTTYISSSSTREKNGAPEGWEGFREGWNTGASAGHRRPWLSASPPPALSDRLAEPGWLDEAARAMPMLPACRRFASPVSLGQFVKPGFVAEVLGGYYRDRPRGRREPDAPAAPQVDPAFEAAARATMAREEARRKAEHRRLDELAATGGDA